MPTVQIVNALNNTYPNFNRSFNGVHGKWIVTLSDSEGTSPKYVLQVREQTTDEVIGELRQSANVAGVAHFDIAPILRTRVSASPDIEQTTLLATADNETFGFYLAAGYVDTDGSVNIQEIDPTSAGDQYLQEYQAFNVVKRYDELNWSWENFASQLYEVNVAGFIFNVIVPSAKALTELTYTEPYSAKTPPCWDSVAIEAAYRICYPISLKAGEDMTLSWVNRADCYDGAEEFTSTQTITHFAFYFVNDTLGTFDSMVIKNSLANGGGPNADPNTAIDTRNNTPYGAITLQVGDRNPQIAAKLNAGGYEYYYVVPLVMRNPENPAGIGACTFVVPDTAVVAGVGYRVDITNGDCNDFENVRLSWLNKYGFRDYFSFEKRNDRQVNVQRNEYTKTQGTWGAQTFSVNTFDRGREIYSQDITESRTINTRYLEDYESEYLRGLYVSPDVRAYINGEWIPIILTSNTWNERTFRKDRLFQHTVTFEFANKETSQQG